MMEGKEEGWKKEGWGSSMWMEREREGRIEKKKRRREQE
jgi:hypothetical protein